MKWLDRLAAVILIDLRDETATITKGTSPARIVREIQDITAQEPHLRGYLWTEKGGRWKFSRSIPAPLQQRIRNVIASL